MLEFENWDLIEHYCTETTIDALGFLPGVFAFSVIFNCFYFLLLTKGGS